MRFKKINISRYRSEDGRFEIFRDASYRRPVWYLLSKGRERDRLVGGDFPSKKQAAAFAEGL